MKLMKCWERYNPLKEEKMERNMEQRQKEKMERNMEKRRDEKKGAQQSQKH